MLKRALISVSDKRDLASFTRGLVARGFELVSTGGTARALAAEGLAVTPVESITGFREILGGRVKTLHPNVHAGILARRDAESLRVLEDMSVHPISVVCVNLYPFEATVAKAGVTLAEAIESIDIGGPAMLRGAAKNFESVWAVISPDDYDTVLANLDLEASSPGAIMAYRADLAARAFTHTAAYDAAIAAYLSAANSARDDLSGAARDDLSGAQPLPGAIVLAGRQVVALRYGENPHQAAALYRTSSAGGPVLGATVLSGKPMGFNNYSDAEAAWLLVEEFSEAACVCVKHGNPCGVATGPDPETAWRLARDADTLSVYGGVVALNRPVTLPVAQALRGTFLEVLIAPEADDDAVAWLRQHKPDLRVLRAGEDVPPGLEIKPLRGGFLAQQPDARRWSDLEPRVVTDLQPSLENWRDLEFAWTVGKHARSNNVVLAKAGVTVGLGSGAVSRIWAAERALTNAGPAARGSALASEAFFPFDDVVRAAAVAGVAAVVQPGGAKRDPEVIAAANELGLTMVFTGSRHFRH